MAYLDQMKGLAMKDELLKNVLITFVLGKLLDDIVGTLLKNKSDELTWDYVYNTCEGLDCSNRATSNSAMLEGSNFREYENL